MYIWSSPLILDGEDERLDAAEDHDDHDDGEDPDQEGEGQPPRGQQDHASGYGELSELTMPRATESCQS